MTSHPIPTMSAACSKKPSTLARMPKPKMLARMPANKPPKRIERQPPKRDALLNGGWAVVGFVGWVKDFSTGATLGAVFVPGGLEYVRDPRLPKLPPPPMRASAAVATKLSAPRNAKAKPQLVARRFLINMDSSPHRL